VSEKQLKELNIRLAPQVAADLSKKSIDGVVDPAAG
jgi:aspartyl-tRNA synthetase